ncbi:hypothetical protein [Parerythrobacter lacustris]|uniref:Uncharacterized protein n=1 Tax=Parerythrobacter lacustris TaxID=2969984 RepID=A0ABT1XSH1_9SPHN|nr:hypothetical protein [Parerythrobacter lacustris]MCR2833387.1 hypothetical protein [Parerythrobacter lacustris]
MSMIFGLSAALPLLLAGANVETKWREDGTVWISATVEIDDPEDAFEKGGKALEEAAVAACGDKGKPREVEEPKLNAMGYTPKGKMQVTLSAAYACG